MRRDSEPCMAPLIEAQPPRQQTLAAKGRAGVAAAATTAATAGGHSSGGNSGEHSGGDAAYPVVPAGARKNAGLQCSSSRSAVWETYMGVVQ